jgi:hypothetical protein
MYVHSEKYVQGSRHQVHISTVILTLKSFLTNRKDRLLKVSSTLRIAASQPRRVFPIIPLQLREGGLSILEQHLKVSLVPLASLWCGAECIGLSAERIVTASRGVAGAVRLSTRLDPDKGIDEWVASGGGRSDTETGSVDVAPISPGVTEALHGVATSIDDGVVGHAARVEERADGVDVSLLVLAFVILGIRCSGELARVGRPGIPTSNVGGNTEYLFGGTGGLVDLGEHICTGLCDLGQLGRI